MNKGLEALKYLDEHNLNWHDNPTKKYVDIIEKELKALEIIKEKRVNVGLLVLCDSVKEYNKNYGNGIRALTQEEFDLLREVLL